MDKEMPLGMFIAENIAHLGVALLCCPGALSDDASTQQSLVCGVELVAQGWQRAATTQAAVLLARLL